MRMTGAKAIIKCLENAGIPIIFGVPGEQNLDIVDATYDSDSVEFISSRHEGGAAFMAEAAGKATGKPYVCMGTAGVGAANLTLGIHTAMQDSTPMIAIVGQVNSEFRGREAWQEIDLDAFYTHIAKLAIEVKSVSRIPEQMHRAIYTAVSGRPGPVVVSVPENFLAIEEDFEFYDPISIKKPTMTVQDADEIIQLINESKRPVIFAGGGIALADARSELLQLSEATSIPVMSAFRRHDVFPNDHDHYLGNSGLGTFPEVMETMQEADLIIALGTRMTEISTQKYKFPTRGQKVIHIDINEHSLINQPFSASISIVSDIKLALSTLLNALESNNTNPAIKQWTATRRMQFTAALNERKQKRKSILPELISIETIVQDMQQLLPDNAILTSDAGTFYTWFANYYEFKQEQRYFGPTSGAMGYGLPSAIAAKMLEPDRPVIALCGDGGLMMTFQEFETAVRMQVPVITIVFNNNSFGAIRLHQERRFPKRVTGSNITNPPFDELARVFGGEGIKVSSNEEFKTALQKAVNNQKPTLIEVPLDLRMISASRMLVEDELKNV